MKEISSLAALSSSSSSSSSSVFCLRSIGCADDCVSSNFHSLRIVAKKSNNKSLQPSSNDSEPPRIKSNLKQNLRILKFWKEVEKRRYVRAKPATRYRKKKAEKEEYPEDTELCEDPTLTLECTNEVIDTGDPVMLVDGYNVCGFWDKLKKHFMNGRLDIARQTLIDELVTFSVCREVKVVVVFDAMMSGLPMHRENFAGVDVVYTSRTSADEWIAKEVVALKEDGCPKVWVVTSDQLEQHAAYGAGAFVWSCKVFISEIKEAQQEVKRMMQEHRSKSMQGKLLKHNLDPNVVDALKDLRDKLKLSENKSRR